jgi:hypothetical protein
LDFGGSWVQNTYHEHIGEPQIHLPYVKKKQYGLCLSAKYDNSILGISAMGLRHSYGVQYLSYVGPSTYYGGLLLMLPSSRNNNTDFTAQAYGGYCGHYALDAYMEPLFDDGPEYGLMGQMRFFPPVSLSLWGARNQHGTWEPQFGMAISYGHTASQRISLPAILHPY